SIKVFFGDIPPAPGKIALFILSTVIVIKEILFYYKLILGKKYNSAALISEAWHHRSDSLSSLAALIGLGLAMVGQALDIHWLIYGDAVAGIIVSIIVIKVGYDLAKDSANIVLEQVLSEEEVAKYKETVGEIKGVIEINELLARMHGRYIVIDIK